MVTPGQTGFGVAVIPAGAKGAFGSDKTTGPAYIPEEHPNALVTTKFV